jgi:hypothetical protein
VGLNILIVRGEKFVGGKTIRGSTFFGCQKCCGSRIVGGLNLLDSFEKITLLRLTSQSKLT